MSDRKSFLSGKLSEIGVYHEAGDSVEALERLFRERGVEVPERTKPKEGEGKKPQVEDGSGIGRLVVDGKEMDGSDLEGIAKTALGGEVKKDEELEQMKAEAKELGVKGFGVMKKETLAAKLEEAKSQEEPAEAETNNE